MNAFEVVIPGNVNVQSECLLQVRMACQCVAAKRSATMLRSGASYSRFFTTNRSAGLFVF